MEFLLCEVGAFSRAGFSSRCVQAGDLREAVRIFLRDETVDDVTVQQAEHEHDARLWPQLYDDAGGFSSVSFKRLLRGPVAFHAPERVWWLNDPQKQFLPLTLPVSEALEAEFQAGIAAGQPFALQCSAWPVDRIEFSPLDEGRWTWVDGGTRWTGTAQQARAGLGQKYSRRQERA